MPNINLTKTSTYQKNIFACGTFCGIEPMDFIKTSCLLHLQKLQYLVTERSGKTLFADAISRVHSKRRFSLLISVTSSGWASHGVALARPARVWVEPAHVFGPEVSWLAVLTIDSGSVPPAADAHAAALVLAVNVKTLPFGLHLHYGGTNTVKLLCINWKCCNFIASSWGVIWTIDTNKSKREHL